MSELVQARIGLFGDAGLDSRVRLRYNSYHFAQE